MSWQNRVRKLINLDIKKEINSKRESGNSVGDLSAEYGMANLMLYYFTHIFFILYYIFRV
jgi:hypothetical protein